MQILTVTAFLTYLNDTFKAIWDPQMVAVEGEVSGFRISQGQWVNFDLKDDGGLVSVFMVLAKLGQPLSDGMRVRLFGYPRVYPKYGKFSFQADRVELVGEGTLQKALALLRKKLADEGLFDPTRKRALPRFPSRIALIASTESAAYGDFVRIIHERWRGLEIDCYHVNVQGEKAPPQIVRAIEMANAGVYDAIVVTRGGGSLEELMSFNDERVVRAIFASKIPTLVGIGHERDLTLAEEAADVRGSTPTDCARRLVPDRAEVLFELARSEERIFGSFSEMIVTWSRRLDDVVMAADHWLELVRARFTTLAERVPENGARWLASLRERFESLERLMRSLDPKAVVLRGFAIVKTSAGKLVTSVAGLTPGMELGIQLKDGSVDAIVAPQEQTLF